MKAIGFNRPLSVFNPEALLDIEMPEPELRPHDILVAVQAVSVNPVDVKVRAAHTPAAGQYRVLGYDAAGIVQAGGSGGRAAGRHGLRPRSSRYIGAANRMGGGRRLRPTAGIRTRRHRRRLAGRTLSAHKSIIDSFIKEPA